MNLTKHTQHDGAIVIDGDVKGLGVQLPLILAANIDPKDGKVLHTAEERAVAWLAVLRARYAAQNRSVEDLTA